MCLLFYCCFNFDGKWARDVVYELCLKLSAINYFRLNDRLNSYETLDLMQTRKYINRIEYFMICYQLQINDNFDEMWILFFFLWNALNEIAIIFKSFIILPLTAQCTSIYFNCQSWLCSQHWSAYHIDKMLYTEFGNMKQDIVDFSWLDNWYTREVIPSFVSQLLDCL